MNAKKLKLAKQMLEAHRRDLKSARESLDTKRVKFLAATQLYNAASAWGFYQDSDANGYDLAMEFSDALETAAIFYTHHQ